MVGVRRAQEFRARHNGIVAQKLAVFDRSITLENAPCLKKRL
jgi:hypothetical protein